LIAREGSHANEDKLAIGRAPNAHLVTSPVRLSRNVIVLLLQANITMAWCCSRLNGADNPEGLNLMVGSHPCTRAAKGPTVRISHSFSAANFSGMYSSHVKAALLMVYCNFCKLHKAHRLTLAMAAGVTDRLGEVADIVELLERWEKAQ
jgi:hypothetical protein